MTVALAGLATGLAFGVLLTRGGICFNRGIRRAFLQGDAAILRVFALIVAVELLAVPVLVAIGVAPVERSVDAGAPALLPVAQLAGGLVFGVGMALAGGCITGILWKTGAGSVATGIAIAGFAAGELLATGAGKDVLSELDDASRPSEGSVSQLSGLPYELVAPIVGVAGLALLLRGRRDGVWLGAALGVVAALAWVAADVADYGYGLGFVGAADGTRDAIESGGELPFQLFLAIGVVAGGAVVARRALRLPGPARAAGALLGGVLMGVGANAAHGCNIGHGVTGLGLLSVGSLLAIAAMATGAVVTARFVRRA
ncbi:MAG: YeeE/YedE thiosulfate transporter family protein [Solirubrobacterales bacterium]